MKMELIQPFINAMDTVLAQTTDSAPKVAGLNMEEEAYRRKGPAALIAIHGDIEGRMVLDMDEDTAMKIAAHLAGGDVHPSETVIRETICELANMVIGNAVTLLNDRGFRFKVFPPEVHNAGKCEAAEEDLEVMVLEFETQEGNVYMNIAMHYLRKNEHDHAAVMLG